LIFLGHKKT